MWDGWHGTWHMGMMWLWGIPLLVLVVFAIKYLGGRDGGSSGRDESAEEILRQRYARGEIDEQTFERMLGELRR